MFSSKQVFAALIVTFGIAACGSDKDTNDGQGGSAGTAHAVTGGVNAGGKNGAEGGFRALGGQTATGGRATSGGSSNAGQSGDRGLSGDSSSEPDSPEAGNAGAQGGSPAHGGGAAGANSAGTGAAGTNSAGGDSACTSADDCDDPNSRVCRPRERTCVPLECDEERPCSTGEVCIYQSTAAAGGACYRSCTPFGSGCSAGEDCVALSLDNAQGFCLARGNGTPQTSCSADAVSTQCVAGSLCVGPDGQQQCEPICDFFSSTPTCPSSQRCAAESLCSSVVADPAALGQRCSAQAEEGTYCGDDGKALRGICTTTAGALTCAELCRTAGNDCGGGSVRCLEFTDYPEIGLCTDQGTCGDGGESYGDCNACLDAAATDCCRSEDTECEVGSPCSLLLECVDSCGEDSTCTQNCVSATPDGVTPLLALFNCLFGSEAQSFSGACGTVCQ